MGFTVTVTDLLGPMHPLAVGVIVYVTMAGFAASELVKVCGVVLVVALPTIETVPPLAPMTLEGDETVQLKTVVPVGLLGLLRGIDTWLPEQIVWLEARTAGIGVMVTVVACAALQQPWAAVRFVRR